MNLKPDEMICARCKRIMSTQEIIPICRYCGEELSEKEYEGLLESLK